MVGSMSSISGARISVIPRSAVILLASPYFGYQSNPFQIGQETGLLSSLLSRSLPTTFEHFPFFKGTLCPAVAHLCLNSFPFIMQTTFGGCLLGDIFVQQQQPFLTMVLIHEVSLAVSLLAARVPSVVPLYSGQSSVLCTPSFTGPASPSITTATSALPTR